MNLNNQVDGEKNLNQRRLDNFIELRNQAFPVRDKAK